MGNKFGSFAKGFAGGVGLGLTWKKVQADEERAKAEEDRKKAQEGRDTTTFERGTEENNRTKRVSENSARLWALQNQFTPPPDNQAAAGMKMPTTQQLGGDAMPSTAMPAAGAIDQGNGVTTIPLPDGAAQKPTALAAPTGRVAAPSLINPASGGLSPEKSQASKTINISESVDEVNRTIYDLIKDKGLTPEQANSYLRMPQMLKEQGITDASRALELGDFAAAEAALNRSGLVGNKYVSSEKSVVKDSRAKYGTEIPTVIGTFRRPDGSTFTIDTGLNHINAIGTEKNISLMQDAVKQADTRAQNAATKAHYERYDATADKKVTEVGSQPVQTVKYLLKSGIAKTPADAWRMNKTLNEKSPEAAAMEMAAIFMKENLDAPAVAAQKARDLVKQFYGQQDAPQGAPGASQPAPAAAIEYLRKNPNMREQFKAKYGYLPEGL